MKTIRALFTVGFVGGCLTGCVAQSKPLVLAPVGPAPVAAPSSSPVGQLEVFSAFETSAGSIQRFENIQKHTSYQIFSASGALVRTVSNQAGAFEDEPEAVQLPPGAYQIKARANGYGLVTVPVIVAEHRTTTVHLEASAPGVAVNDKDAVRLPSGLVVGWKAQGEGAPAF